MNQPPLNEASASARRPWNRSALRWGVLGGLALFAAGAASSAWWFLSASSSDPAAQEALTPPALSPATASILRHLNAPLQITFYSLLDGISDDDPVRGLSARVDQLLTRYQELAPGKLAVRRVNSASANAANAALADGLQPFHLAQGDACYLGLVVDCGGRRTTLPALAPQWEVALESDLSRAIAEVDYPIPAPPSPAPQALAARAAVQQAIPGLQSVSLEDGSRQLRMAALVQFRETAEAMRDKVSQAEQRLLDAQHGGTQAAQESALHDLQQAQMEQTQKLRDIALESKAQLDALRQLKGDSH